MPFGKNSKLYDKPFKTIQDMVCIIFLNHLLYL